MALMVGVMLAACAPSRAPRVWADYDPQTIPQLAAYRSYAWLAPPEDDLRADDLTEGRIVAAVDTVLQARGFEKSSRERADFLIGYFVTVRGKVEKSRGPTYGVGIGSGGASFGVGFGSSGVRTYEEGTLVLDILDATEEVLVWRGSAEGRLDPDPRVEPARRQESMNQIVTEILKRFPPQ